MLWGQVNWGTGGYVHLLDNELFDLIKKFSKPGTEARIEQLSLHKGSTGKTYRSDYFTIIAWDQRRGDDDSEFPEPDWSINEAWLEKAAPGLLEGAIPTTT
jgi:hypothetical protein